MVLVDNRLIRGLVTLGSQQLTSTNNLSLDLSCKMQLDSKLQYSICELGVVNDDVGML